MVIVGEEENEMERLMKTDELHLKVKKNKMRRNEENPKFFSKSRMTKILGSSDNVTKQPSTSNNMNDETVTLVDKQIHLFFQQKKK